MYRQILIIDKDLVTSKQLKYALLDRITNAYYAVSTADGIRHLLQEEYHLVIMSISPSDLDGFDTLKLLHDLKSIPILAISEKDDSALIVKLLTLGADDYLKKPLDISLLHAKIRALFRRCFDEKFVQKSPYVSNRTGDLLVSPLYQRIFLKGVEIVLPRKQFELFYLLFSNGRQVFTRDQLCHTVWGEDFEGTENTLNCQMSNLRRQLESVNGAPDYIKTKRGVGYYFDTEV